MTLGGYEVNTLSATLERLALTAKIVTLARDLEREKGTRIRHVQISPQFGASLAFAGGYMDIWFGDFFVRVNEHLKDDEALFFANAPTIDLQEGSVNADAVWETVNPASNTWWRVDRAAGPVGRFDPAGLYFAGFPNPDIITSATPGTYIMNQTTWVWTSTFTGYYPIQFNGGGGYLRLTYNPTSTTDYAYLGKCLLTYRTTLLQLCSCIPTKTATSV
jgi:hypothetical protein